MKLSIVVRCYNAENTLERCLESLHSQTFEDCEFIVVNDGSTDSSLSIIEHYVKKDCRFRLITHEENLGSGAAYISGLKTATGEYIGNVDADDHIFPDVLMTVAATMGEADVYVFQVKYSAWKKTRNTLDPRYFLIEDLTVKFTGKHYFVSPGHKMDVILCNECRNGMANKFFKRSLFRIDEMKPYKMGEDIIFMIPLIHRAKSVELAPVTFYCRDYTEASLTSKKTRTIEKLRDKLLSLIGRIQFLMDHEYSPEYVRRCLNTIETVMKQAKKYNNEEFLKIARNYYDERLPRFWLYSKNTMSDQDFKNMMHFSIERE